MIAPVEEATEAIKFGISQMFCIAAAVSYDFAPDKNPDLLSSQLSKPS